MFSDTANCASVIVVSDNDKIETPVQNDVIMKSSGAYNNTTDNNHNNINSKQNNNNNSNCNSTAKNHSNRPARNNATVAGGFSRRMEINFRFDNTPYILDKVIGSGAYGAVGLAVDTRTGTNVAVKKIARAFAALTLIKRTLREVRILREVKHENIVSVLDMFTAEGSHGRDIYLVMDLMETDLHQIIHSTQKLCEQHNQYFLFQILRGLKYMHSVGIVHRDMKPSNLLVNGNCLLKIADFGMARSLDQCKRDESSVMTKLRVDIWSAGCIFAEMIMRRQLFPGRDAVMQIKMIVCYLGTPIPEVMDKISSQLVRTWIERCGARVALPWTTILPKATSKAVDLIEKLMQVPSWRRWSAEEALAHPYLDLYHDPDNEPVGVRNVQFDADAVETMESSCLKDALLAETHHFQGHIRSDITDVSKLSVNDEDDEEDRSQITTIAVNPSPNIAEFCSTTANEAMDTN